MLFFRRQHSPGLGQLIEHYRAGGMSRRTFLHHMQGAMALSLTATSASALLAACGDASRSSTGSDPITSTPEATPIATSGTPVTVLCPWSGDELDSFQHVIETFEQESNTTVTIVSTPDVTTQLTTSIKANKHPDLAVLSGPGSIQFFASQGKLSALNPTLNPTDLQTDYSQFWINQGSYQGNLYAIFVKASNKSTIWYNPSQFQQGHYQIPQTWDEMITLSNTIAGDGKYPWSLGVKDDTMSGWPAADWIAQIFLSQSGPHLYDQWAQHNIPWTHSSVKNAFNYFAQIINGHHYIEGGAQAILSTQAENALSPLYSQSPTAYMNYLGDFAEDYIAMHYSNAIPGTDFNFFTFPSINPQYAGAITGGADAVVALNTNDTTLALIQYLSEVDAQRDWAQRGGYTSINMSLDLNDYPNAVMKASAQQLTAASTFRYGIADLLPPAVRAAFLQGMLAFIQHPDQLSTILNTIESTASRSYPS